MAIDKKNKLVVSNTKDLFAKNSLADISRYDAIISAGVDASIAVSRLNFNKTILMSMIPKESFISLNKTKKITCNKNCHVVFLEQPVKRQLQLIKFAFPNATQLAVIGSKQSSQILNEITDLSADFGFTLKLSLATNESSVLTALNQSLASADVLMAIPDPIVFNRDTARAILLTAFHHHVPLFAYSKSFVQAGATIGLFSTPEDIAQHIATLLSRPTPSKVVQHTMYPKYFTIDINRRAAEALDIDIPDISYLENWLKTDEK